VTDDLLQEEEFQGNLNVALWRRMLRYTWPYRKSVLGLIGVAGLLTACDLGLATLTCDLFDAATRQGPRAALLPYNLAYVGIAALQCLAVFGFINLAGRISTHVSHDIRKAGFAKLQELSFSYYDRRPVGWLMARLTSDCERLSRLMGWGLMDLVWGAAFILAVAILLLVFNWRVALISFLVIPPLAWVSRLFQKRILLTSRQARKANSIVTAAYNEALMGVRTTKTLVREEENLREFQGLTNDLFDHSLRNTLQSAFFWPTVNILGSIGQGLALWAGGSALLAGTMTVGALILFLQYSQRFFDPIHEMARTFAQILGAQAAAERVQELLDTEPEIKDSPEVLAAIARRAETHPPSAAPDGLALDGLPDRVGEIEFRHVSFAYKAGPTILKDFNLRVRPHETIALVGPTGGGKSTIASLLCRFYEPTAGEVCFDGIDYRRRSLRWLQAKLGIVLQAPHLFSGTIRENILYGNLGASDEDLYRAAHLANADRFIAAMEHGYDSPVGPGGNRLSTGQKQLVALARAILADPPIFIMDEATSSVDTETERLIQRGVETVLKNRTSFVIAHRLSTIRSADRILVIERGRIAEEGNHHDLMQQRGKYFRLYSSQFTHEMEAEALRGRSEPRLDASGGTTAEIAD